jgi:hypothetical protein
MSGTQYRLKMTVLPDLFAVCRLEGGSTIPEWATAGSFFSVTGSPEELSILCPEDRVPQDCKAERGWRGLRVEGPLDFSLIGVLASLTAPLAARGISIFAVSTYDTDYLLVRSGQLEAAREVLREVGHVVS